MTLTVPRDDMVILPKDEYEALLKDREKLKELEKSVVHPAGHGDWEGYPDLPAPLKEKYCDRCGKTLNGESDCECR